MMSRCDCLRKFFFLFIKFFRVWEIKKLKSHSTCRLAVDNILYDSEKSVCMDRRRKSFYFFTKRAENFSSTSLNDFFCSPYFGCWSNNKRNNAGKRRRGRSIKIDSRDFSLYYVCDTITTTRQ